MTVDLYCSPRIIFLHSSNLLYHRVKLVAAFWLQFTSRLLLTAMTKSSHWSQFILAKMRKRDCRMDKTFGFSAWRLEVRIWGWGKISRTSAVDARINHQLYRFSFSYATFQLQFTYYFLLQIHIIVFNAYTCTHNFSKTLEKLNCLFLRSFN